MHVCNDDTVKTASTFAHVLCDYIDGFLGHHSIELHQLIVSELLHYLSFLQEGLRWHRAGLKSLHCHLGGAIPRTWEENPQNVTFSLIKRKNEQAMLLLT